jgi:hypothetical protein
VTKADELDVVLAWVLNIILLLDADEPLAEMMARRDTMMVRRMPQDTLRWLRSEGNDTGVVGPPEIERGCDEMSL